VDEALRVLCASVFKKVPAGRGSGTRVAPNPMSHATRHAFATRLLTIGCFAASLTVLLCVPSVALNADDPANWGEDHVGKTFPAYVTGDECLFCHRKVGETWSDNRHQLTIRPARPDDPAVRMLRQLPGGNELAAETRYLMGSQRITRFLRRSSEYGKLDVLSVAFVPGQADANETASGKLNHVDKPHWDQRTFGDRCAGCHATGVDSQSRAFSAVSIDCVSCHGVVDLGHSKDISLVLLSKTSREPRQIVSICGQCHLRGGTSKASGLPYPNTFVAGDNLLRDFQVEFTDEAIQSQSPLEQHIWLNTREVAVLGKSQMTCLICHEVHKQSTGNHRQLADAAICSSCHLPGKDKTTLRDGLLPLSPRQTRSRVCDY
jgi:hypothetical protein